MHITSLKKRLGDILVDVGIISREQLKEALDIQKRTGGKLGDILSRMDIINEEVLLAFLGKQCGVSYVSLKEYGDIPDAVIRSLPESVIRRQTLIPIAKEHNTVTIAMADPFNVFAVDDIKLMTGYDVQVVIALESEIRAAIDKHFSRAAEAAQYASLSGAPAEAVARDKLSDNENQHLNAILSQALFEKSSEVLFEPQANFLRVRFRIDGILYEKPPLPKEIQGKITRQIKQMADLNISEQRSPQDGYTKIKINDQAMDMRVSLIPTIFGEKAQLQIINVLSVHMELSKLGFEPSAMAIYKHKIEKTGGLILITGPIGSGKTTTLYSTLSALNLPSKNIITIENPVKYVLPGITQMQVHTDSGMSFVSLLQAAWRQNADIMLVRELRDQKTAHLAMNIALSGHMVFSTSTSGNTVEALAHLSGMGLEPFLIASSLVMVVAQRLIRVICPQCKESYKATKDSIKGLGIKNAGEKEKLTLYRGRGCAACAHTGYSGRTGIFEILDIDKDFRALILERAPVTGLQEEAQKKKMMTLRESAWQKVRAGASTVEEMLRITEFSNF